MKIDFNKFLNKSKKIITTMEIGKNWLRIIQAEQIKREKRIFRIIIKDISTLQDEAISKMLKDLSKQLGIDPRYLILHCRVFQFPG